MLFPLLLSLSFLSAAQDPPPTAPPTFALSNPKNQSNEVLQSLSFGHLLTSNNNVLAEDQKGVGSTYLGYGLTDEWTIATSPFVSLTFNMISVLSRYAVDLSEKSRFGIDVAYFKTIFEKESEYAGICQSDPDYNSCIERFQALNGYKNFQMEAASLKLTYSRLVKPKYRWSTSLSYFYYFDESRPFSFRMDPQNSDPFALSLTTLHEIRIKKRDFLNLEAGVWGLNYEYLYYHTGFSVNHQTEKWLWSFGFTSTWSPSFPRHRVRQFNYYDSRASLHPEIQIQTFF